MTVNTPTIHNWPELLSSVDHNKGVYRATMATLRELEGRQRAGKHIRQAIQDKLASLGLGHLPEELPNRQQQAVLLYKVGTPASEMVQAVKRGLTESPPEAAYTLLHRLNSLPDPSEVVHRDKVEETVNREVGTAVEQVAQSVFEMLAKVNPKLAEGSVPEDERREETAADGRNAMDLMASLRQLTEDSDKELSGA